MPIAAGDGAPQIVSRHNGRAHQGRALVPQGEHSNANRCSPGADGPMKTFQTPDDIKIIAQFLAERASPGRDWQELTREAFALRKALRERGGYKLARAPNGRAQGTA